MKEWIPLMQSLIWPIFITVVIYKFRSRFDEILEAVKVRIEKGSPFNVGPGGINLGSAPQLPDDPEPEEMIDDGVEVSAAPELIEKEQKIEQSIDNNPIEKLQLVHTSRFLKVKNGRDYYRIVVSLDPYNTKALSQVEKVVYFLHKTFRNPVREVTDSKSNFELRTAAWGEFTIRAEVYVKGSHEPLRLSRYLDINTRK
ncbi:pYEATS domain-containing protein [Pleionea sediminis]|uniref:pYEATS domain-containing protein n=1 Tax=Pleionea sediminis TaxID=2569479 RepID=UPI0013DE5874|nr:pYEATS domain-containing protein [Pleionea sediminis]